MAANTGRPQQGVNKDTKSVMQTTAPTAPEDLLADQTFAEARDELDANAGMPRKKPTKAKPKHK